MANFGNTDVLVGQEERTIAKIQWSVERFERGTKLKVAESVEHINGRDCGSISFFTRWSDTETVNNCMDLINQDRGY